MAKLKVSVLEIIGKLEDSKPVVDLLQRKGVAELIKTDYDGVMFNEFSGTVSQFDRFYSDACDALSILKRYAPEKTSITDKLSGRKEITLNEMLEKTELADSALSVSDSINSLMKRISDDRIEIQRNIVSLDILSPWMELDIPTNYHGTKEAAVFVGSFQKQLTREEILLSIANDAPYADAVDVEIVSVTKGLTCIVAFAGRKFEKQVEKALRNIGFSYPSDPTKHPPKVRYERLTKRNEDLFFDIADCEEKIKSYASERDNLKFLCDYLLLRKDKYEALSMFGMTDTVFVITCYCPERDAIKLKAYIEKRFTSDVTVKDPPEDAEVPVVLENGWFSKPVEKIVGMYSLPGKNDVDPTSLTAFFYYFFFGMMLSDAGYGLMMVVAIAIILKKFKLEESMRNTLKMYMFCGVSTVFWGAMYGSWWGDWFSVFNQSFLGGSPLNLALWLDPLKELMRLMVWCFGFGLVHLFFGVGIKGVNLWKKGQKFDAFCETIPTYVFILGTAPIFVSLFINVPDSLKALSPYVIAVGAVLVIATAGREAKSIGGKIGKGLYGIYNLLSGYLGDVLSYSRLLALGLATGVIAQVINLMGTLPSNMVLKTIMFIIVSIIGHIANLAINLIGAYVHTTRLQYVEYFSKFYEGGGVALKPLSLKTQYYRLKTEIDNESKNKAKAKEEIL